MAIFSVLRFSQRRGRPSVLWMGAVVAIVGVANSAFATVINFDDLPHTGGTVLPLPGSQYAGSGILFSSGTIPGLPMPGDVFTMTDLVDGFAYVSNSNCVSGPNFAGARDVGLQDTLFSFTSPVGSLSMTSDSAADGPTFRLLALEATGAPNSYRVLAVDEAVTGFQDSLSLSLPGGFSFAAFQVTTEQEGYDDICFSTVPAPGSLIAIVVSGLVTQRRRRSR